MDLICLRQVAALAAAAGQAPTAARQQESRRARRARACRANSNCPARRACTSRACARCVPAPRKRLVEPGSTSTAAIVTSRADRARQRSAPRPPRARAAHRCARSAADAPGRARYASTTRSKKLRPGPRTGPARAPRHSGGDLGRQVEPQRESGCGPCWAHASSRAQCVQIEAAPAALVGEGGVGEAVAEHHAPGERRLDQLHDVLAPAAKTSSASVYVHRGVQQFLARSCSASGVPPGSRVRSTVAPRRAARSATAPMCDDLPAPSMPSKVMKRPRLKATCRAGTDSPPDYARQVVAEFAGAIAAGDEVQRRRRRQAGAPARRATPGIAIGVGRQSGVDVGVVGRRPAGRACAGCRRSDRPGRRSPSGRSAAACPGAAGS